MTIRGRCPLGAAQAPSTHFGFEAATSAAGTSWTRKVSANAASPYDGINFFPVTIGGAPMIIAESGDSGAVGPYDGIWMSAYPYRQPFLLKSLALNTVAAPNEAIAMGNYVWIGSNRITREKFIWQ